jgi:hypothetical protein
VVHKAKKTSAKVPKAKAPIITSKKPFKTLGKSLKNAVVVEKVKKVVIRQNSRSYIINLLKRFKNKK